MIKYELLEANPDLVGVSVCDSRRWLSSDARIYFADGTLQYNGQLAKAFQVNVEHCNFEKRATDSSDGNWYPCRFGVRPIFECDSHDDAFGHCRSVTPCAWAINQDGSPPQAVSCGAGSGLCGTASSFVKLAPDCNGRFQVFGQDQKDNQGCVRGSRELSDGLKAAASKAGFACGDNCADNMPLIELSNPQEMKRKLRKWTTVWYLCAFVYCGVPVLCIWAVLACKKVQARKSDRTYRPIPE